MPGRSSDAITAIAIVMIAGVGLQLMEAVGRIMMKFSHRLDSHNAGPLWGLAFGLIVTLAGVGLWCDAKLSQAAGRFDEPLAVAAVLVGVFAAIYAAHELRHR